MTFSSLRIAALALAFSAAFGTGAASGATSGQAGAVLIESMAVTLPASFDFEAGSSVLELDVQSRLQTETDHINRAKLDSIMVTGFSNTANAEHRQALGLERARSVRAFFILNGIEPSRIHVDYVDFTDQRNSRPGQVQFEVVENFTG